MLTDVNLFERERNSLTSVPGTKCSGCMGCRGSTVAVCTSESQYLPPRPSLGYQHPTAGSGEAGTTNLVYQQHTIREAAGLNWVKLIKKTKTLSVIPGQQIVKQSPRGYFGPMSRGACILLDRAKRLHSSWHIGTNYQIIQ